MNSLLLFFALFMLLGGNKNASGLFGSKTDNAFDMLKGLGKLGEGDKMGAIMDLMSNPILMDMMKNMTKSTENKPSEEKSAKDTPKHSGQSNETESKTPPGKPTEQGKEWFFSPIDDIATTQIKQELYDFYDNWYVTK